MRLHLRCVMTLLFALLVCRTPGVADSVSPDGKFVAYCVPSYDRQAERISEVFICATDGSSRRKLGVFSDHLTQIMWLAGDALAFTDRANGAFQVVRTDGKRLPDLKLPEGCNAIHKALSPDGKRVAFEGSLERAGKRQYGLFVCDAKNGEVRCLIEKTVRTTPAWSPDSRKVAVGIGAYQKDYLLQIFDVEAGRVDDTGALGVGAAWSLDGKYIACTTDVKRGGSWFDGIPSDGRLGIYDVEARKMTAVEGTDGAIRPAWSQSGKVIAYIVPADEKPGVFVIEPGVGAPRQIFEGKGPVIRVFWSSDEAVYIQTQTGIFCARYPSAETSTVAEWKEPAAPELTPEDYNTVEVPRVTARYARFDRKYATALARILSEAVKVYEELGFKMPEKLTFDACIEPSGTALWTDGESAVFLTLRSKELLAPSTRTGVFNIYGMCHELGHIAMYKDMESMIGLPAGVGEGWAHYVGSVVVSEVARRLGKGIWPEPYDVSDVEGMGRLRRQADLALGKTWDEMDATTRASLVFYRLESEYGREKVTSAMVSALARHPSGKDLMGLVLGRVRAVVGSQRAADWVPASVIVAKIEWKVKERNPGDEFFADQKVEKDESGVQLSYDDGIMDTKLSSSGCGYTVLFRAPEGSWQLDGVKLFGSRYGTDEPPKEDFSIYVCDEDFNPLHTIRLPYGIFERGEERWYDLKFDPVDVPSKFYVCVDFQATASKGVYVGQDAKAERSHSYMALPYTYVGDMRSKVDWMIRAHLRAKA